MGTSKKQVQANREAILAAADCLFRERGVDAVGIVELMEAAGLTRGGFYNHFHSKAELVDLVLGNTLADANERLADALDVSARSGADALDEQVDWYLSGDHRSDIRAGCPVSGFAADVRRLDESVRTQFSKAVEAYIEQFSGALRTLDHDIADRRGRAIGMVSTMVGALMLSRAVADVSPGLSEELLAEGRRAAKAERADRRQTSPASSCDL